MLPMSQTLRARQPRPGQISWSSRSLDYSGKLKIMLVCAYTVHTHNSSIHIPIISNCIIHICGFPISKCVKIQSSTTDKKEVGGSVSDRAWYLGLPTKCCLINFFTITASKPPAMSVMRETVGQPVSPSARHHKTPEFHKSQVRLCCKTFTLSDIVASLPDTEKSTTNKKVDFSLDWSDPPPIYCW